MLEPEGSLLAGSTVRWRAFFNEAKQRLGAAGFPTAENDARRIVEQASGFDGNDFLVALEEFATKRGVVAFDSMIARRLTGEPLQYVLGRWGFRSLDLMVDHRVLIPRPETEVVAGIAIEEVDRLSGAGVVTVVDLGTGSGAIGLSVAAERAVSEVVLTDASPEALQVARANLAGLGRSGTRVSIASGSWFEALEAQLRDSVHVIVSNPPYVAETDELPDDVRGWEPSPALIAGETGTEQVEHLIEESPIWLRPGGALVLEMAPHQVEAMATRARVRGFDTVDIVVDLAGRDRAVRAIWPG